MVNDIRVYEIEGLSIVSRITHQERNGAGGVIRIRSELDGRAVENSLSFSGGEPREWALESARRKFATLFARQIRGVARVPVNLGVLVRLGREGHEGSSAIAARVDLDLERTLLLPEVVKSLGLVPTGSHVELTHPNLGTFRAPTYRAKVTYGDEVLDLDVASWSTGDAHQGQPLCVIGQDAVGVMRRRGASSYYALVPSRVRDVYQMAMAGRSNLVLLIGCFSREERARLDRLKDLLFDLGYQAILLDEFPDPEDYSLDQKMMFLASLCRFVVCVDSRPAGHYSELDHCARFGLVTAVVVGWNGKSELTSAMLWDIESRNRHCKKFVVEGELGRNFLEGIIEWADVAYQEKARYYNERYAEWRGRG